MGTPVQPEQNETGMRTASLHAVMRRLARNERWGLEDVEAGQHARFGVITRALDRAPRATQTYH